MKFYCYLILSFLSLCSYADAIKLYTMEIPNINTRSQKSFYAKYIKMIEAISGEKFEIIFLPPSRAMSKFSQNHEACFFPYSKKEKVDSSSLLFSKPFADIELYAITKKNSELITRSNIYENKRVAINSSYRESFFFPAEFKVYYVETEQQLFYMLDHGRVDYVLESVPDVYLSFGGKEEFLKRYKFDPKYKHQILKDYFTCHKGSKRIENLIKTINNKL